MLSLHYSLCSFWNVLFFVCALFGMCCFWHVLFLERAFFGMCPFWNVPYLTDSVKELKMCSIRNSPCLYTIPYLKCALFGMCSFWNVLFFVNPKICLGHTPFHYAVSTLFPLWSVSFHDCAVLDCVLFGMCSFWNVFFLECAIFGMCSLWNVPFLECALFEMEETNKNNAVAVMGSASHLFLPAFRWLSSGLVWQAELAVGGKERCWRPPTWPPLHKVRPELSVVCKDSYSVESKSERGAARRLRARLQSNITAVRAAPVTLVHMVVQ